MEEDGVPENSQMQEEIMETSHLEELSRDLNQGFLTVERADHHNTIKGQVCCALKKMALKKVLKKMCKKLT